MSAEPIQQPQGGKNVLDILCGRVTCWLALIAIVASFLLPTEGAGIKLCATKFLFDVPCPGCGLTRSVTNVSHLQPIEAWNYHPFGLIIHPFFCVAALFLLLPDRARKRIGVWCRRRHRVLYSIYMTIVFAFLAFGFTRLGLALAGITDFAKISP